MDNKKPIKQASSSSMEGEELFNSINLDSKAIEGIEKLLALGMAVGVEVIPAKLLKLYANGDDANIEKILSSRSERAIGLISDERLKAYASQKDDNNIHKILSSCSERAISLISDEDLKVYSSSNFYNNIEDILNSRSEKAISLIGPDAVTAYARLGKSYMEKIFKSKSVTAVKFIHSDMLRLYLSGSDSNIENILSCQVDKIISLVSNERLKAYVSVIDDGKLEKILRSHSEQVIDLIPIDRLISYVSRGDDYVTRVLKSKSAIAIDSIPINILTAYIDSGDYNVENLLKTRSYKAIDLISDERLKAYASGGGINIANILNSRSKRAIGMIPNDMLIRYADGTNSNIKSVLNSRVDKAIRLISDERLKEYINEGGVNIEIILASRAERVISMIPSDILKHYASGSNFNIEKILNSRSGKVINLISNERLESYVIGVGANIEKILGSRFAKAVEMIPDQILESYVKIGYSSIENVLNSQIPKAISFISEEQLKTYASGGGVKVERVLNSHFEEAISLIPRDRLIDYASGGNICVERILKSKSITSIDLIPIDRLISYISAGDSSLENILASRSHKAVALISDERLKAYAHGGDVNIEKILDSRAESAIKLIPVSLLRVYARRGGNVYIEKILDSRSISAIEILPDKDLKTYIRGSDCNIEKILNSGSSKAIAWIPGEKLASYIGKIRFRLKQRLPSLERQSSLTNSESPDLSHDDIVKIEALLDSRDSLFDSLPLNKLVRYAEGDHNNIEKILSSGSEEMIDLIPGDNLVSYSRKGNKAIEMILNTRSMSAINLISITRLRIYLYSVGDGDTIGSLLNSRSERAIDLISEARLIAYAKNNINIEKILNSYSDRAIIAIISQLKEYLRHGGDIEKVLATRSNKVISLIADELNIYIRGGDNNLEKILNSRLDKAIDIIPDAELKAYASKGDINIKKVLASKSNRAISLIIDQLKAYSSSGKFANVREILNSQSDIAIKTIPAAVLKNYIHSSDSNLGNVLSSRSERAIGLIPTDLLRAYGKGSDANLEKMLDSQSSKVIRLIPADSLKVYMKKGDINIGKVLNSRSNIAIGMIPSTWLVLYASAGYSNLERVLDSRSEIAIDLIPDKKLKAYAREGNINVGKIIESRSDRAIKLIPKDILSAYAQAMHYHSAMIEPYIIAYNEVGSSRITPKTCLSRGRVARQVLRGGCEISWDVIDKFNEEKEKPREFSEIKINSDKFLPNIQDSSYSALMRAQLLQLADEVAITGGAKEQVRDLVANQGIALYLNQVKRVSNILTYGQVGKNILGDLLKEDYQDVAANIGFIALGEGVHKLAEAATVSGEKLLLNANVFSRSLGQSLKLASPFIARATSGFILYDLASQIKAYKQGDPDALIKIEGDGIYLGIEGAELGIEVAEIGGILEGVSSFTGPIGAAVGIVVLVSSEAYLAVRRVNRIEALIPLTNIERIVERLRALVGMEPREYIKELELVKQANNKLYQQGIEFLKNHTDIQRYVFPAAVFGAECKIKWEWQRYNRDSLLLAPRFSKRVSAHEECTQAQWKTDLSKTVMLDLKRKNIKWDRAKPDVKEGSLLCAPVATLDSVGILPEEDTYFCDNALGVEYANFRTGNTTLIALGKGNDTVLGFPFGSHIVVLGDGRKDIEMGDGDDIFLLEANKTKGLLIGGNGVNTLDLEHFARQETVRLVSSEIEILSKSNRLLSNYLISIYIGDNVAMPENFSELLQVDSIKVNQIQRFLLRTKKKDIINIVGSDISFIDGRGGEEGGQDLIQILRNAKGDIEPSNLTVMIRPYTVIHNYNINKNSSYTYFLPQQTGTALVSISANCAAHRFVFEASLLDLLTFQFDNSREGCLVINLSFTKSKAFLTLFNLRIDLKKTSICSAKQRLLFQLTDSTEIKILENKFYVFQQTNHSVEEILLDYPVVADRFNFSMVIHSVLSNESIAIGSGMNDVLHNDPNQRSHLMGNGGENVFVITLDKKYLTFSCELVIPEVVLYDKDDKNLIDTLDLRPIREVLERHSHLEIKARISLTQEVNDIIIQLFASENPSCNLVLVRLKDALITNWHRRLHIILNHVLMKVELLNLKPLPLKLAPDRSTTIMGPEDIEENLKLIISKKIGNYRFIRWKDDDLMITNIFRNKKIKKVDRYVLLFREFYQTQMMESIVIEFLDRELNLKDEIDYIMYATDFSSEYLFLNSEMYGILSNQTEIRVDNFRQDFWDKEVNTAALLPETVEFEPKSIEHLNENPDFFKSLDGNKSRNLSQDYDVQACWAMRANVSLQWDDEEILLSPAPVERYSFCDSIKILDLLKTLREIAVCTDCDLELINGEIPLSWAVSNNFDVLVEALLKRSFDTRVNVRLANGETLLYLAIKYNSLSVVKKLLEHGANFSERVLGKTPLDWAKYYGHDAIIKELQENDYKEFEEFEEFPNAFNVDSSFFEDISLFSHIDTHFSSNEAKVGREQLIQKIGKFVKNSAVLWVKVTGQGQHMVILSSDFNGRKRDEILLDMPVSIRRTVPDYKEEDYQGKLDSFFAKKTISFFKRSSNVYRYILPTVKLEVSYSKIRNNTGEWKQYNKALNNTINLYDKKKDIKWRRTKPDLSDGSFFCVPAGNDLQIPGEGAYLCDNAMGIEYSKFRTGNITILELGDGNDTAVGFPYGEHLVWLGRGYKKVHLGEGDDTFLLTDTLSSDSVLDGGGGVNTLDFRGFVHSAEYIIVDANLKRPNISTVTLKRFDGKTPGNPAPLVITGINRLFLSDAARDVLKICSSSIHYIDGRGGKNSTEVDTIIIANALDCGGGDYSLTLVANPFTSIVNSEGMGRFIYFVPRREKVADRGLDAVHMVIADKENAAHRFLFNYTLHEVIFLKTIENKEDKTLGVMFGLGEVSKDSVGSMEAFNISISCVTSNSRYQLSDGTEIKVNHRGFYAFRLVNSSVEMIQKNYLYIAEHLNITLFFQSSLVDESIRIGHLSLSNNPYKRSHLIGYGQKNVFVIYSGHKTLSLNQLPLPEVILYCEDNRDAKDILRLDKIISQFQKDLHGKVQIRTDSDGGDIVLRLFIPGLSKGTLMNVRLKNELAMDRWMRRLHIVLDDTGKFYRLGHHLIVDSSLNEKAKVKVSRAARLHSDMAEERVEGAEKNRSAWETVSSYGGYLLYGAGILLGGIGGFMAYRYRLGRRVEPDVVSQMAAVSLPLLVQQAEALPVGSSSQKLMIERMDAGAKGWYTTQTTMVHQASLFKLLLYSAGCRDAVKRMNKIEKMLACVGSEESVLGLAERQLGNRVEAGKPKRKFSQGDKGRISSNFFKDSALSPLMVVSNDIQYNGMRDNTSSGAATLF